jgi:hypothetical protein
LCSGELHITSKLPHTMVTITITITIAISSNSTLSSPPQTAPMQAAQAYQHGRNGPADPIAYGSTRCRGRGCDAEQLYGACVWASLAQPILSCCHRHIPLLRHAAKIAETTTSTTITITPVLTESSSRLELHRLSHALSFSVFLLISVTIESNGPSAHHQHIPLLLQDVETAPISAGPGPDPHDPMHITCMACWYLDIYTVELPQYVPNRHFISP